MILLKKRDSKLEKRLQTHAYLIRVTNFSRLTLSSNFEVLDNWARKTYQYDRKCDHLDPGVPKTQCQLYGSMGQLEVFDSY